MNVRRFAVLPIALLAILLLFGWVATAAAVPPDKEPPAEEETFILSEACDFDVLLEDLWNNSSLIYFYDQEGNLLRFVSVGALKTRLTNMESGKSIDLNISGPAFFKPLPDDWLLLSGGGPWLFFELGVDELPELALVHGRTELLIDPDGNVEVLTLRGKVEDVCSMIADS
jgi:hypothetical protein